MKVEKQILGVKTFLIMPKLKVNNYTNIYDITWRET